ncbi:hypothetical protein PWT90_08018 [Aphanocladium album]|nr:hypothetical protein PWT90_08018 [Aphanocladium album]
MAMDRQEANVLLAGLNCRGSIHLVVGTNPLAAARCAQSLAAGAHPVLVAPAASDLHYGLQAKIDDGSVKWEQKVFEDGDLFRLGRDEVDGVVDAVFVTTGPRETSAHISALCRRNRILVNVVDAPDLCTLTLLSTYADGPLQVGVTTNGRGCKLASRIRREIAASLPAQLGAATARLGDARRRIIQQDQCASNSTADADDDSTGQSSSFNKLVTEENEDVKTRRMRWLSQVCEYWPLSRLAAVTDDDVEKLLTSYPGAAGSGLALPPSSSSSSAGSPASGQQKLGRLVLAGSGPGAPHLPPEFVASRTVVFLMALHRIGGLVRELTTTPVELAGEGEGEGEAGGDVIGKDLKLKRTLWPTTTPCAVVERASCPDQRVIRTTLGRVAQAVEEEGSRPPGLLVVGAACDALEGPLEKGRAWVVEEGFRGLDGLVSAATGLEGLEGQEEVVPTAVTA